MKHIDALNAYFEKELPKLKEQEDYWPIPKIPGFNKSREKSYQANVELKHYLYRRWHSAPNSEKMKWTNIIVSDWGGIRANKCKTLQRYINEIATPQPKTPIYGVASYSKLFSIVYPEKYAIYDARVAVSLNAIQCLYRANERWAFNYIPGRNKKIDFVCKERLKVKTLVNKKWKKIKRDETYDTYLCILKECLSSFSQYQLYDLEMVLFSNAERLCERLCKEHGARMFNVP